MKITTLTLTLLLSACLAAQTTKPKSKPGSQPSTTKPKTEESAFTGPKLDEKSYAHFGDGAHEGKALSVAEVLKDKDKHIGQQIRLKGDIRSVCLKRGCWMNVGEGDQQIHVRFKEYAFFMPLDSAGRETIVEGTLREKEISVDEQKHLLEDAGKTEEAAKITAPKKQLDFMASGVAIKNAEPKPADGAGTKKVEEPRK